MLCNPDILPNLLNVLKESFGVPRREGDDDDKFPYFQHHLDSKTESKKLLFTNPRDMIN